VKCVDSDNEGESPGDKESEDNAEDSKSGLAKKVRRVDSPRVDSDDNVSDENVEDNSSDEEDLDEQRESGKGEKKYFFPCRRWLCLCPCESRSHNSVNV
jgi:hypothetical protein